MSVLAVENRVPKHIPITVDMYHYMAENGVFRPDERVELIDGEIFEMSPVGSLHVRCVNFLTDFLVRKLAGEYLVSIQNPIISANDTEPQPDLAILRRHDNLYKFHLPTGSDTLIVIEVADTSASFDRNRKFPKYAQAGIPEVWLVNLNTDTITVYSKPQGGSFLDVQTFNRGDVVATSVPSLKLNANEFRN